MCHVAEGERGGSKISKDLPASVSLSKCPEEENGSLNKETLHMLIHSLRIERN